MISQLQIRSSSHSYNVQLGEGLLAHVGCLIREQSFGRTGEICAVITDETVRPLYASMLEQSLRDAGFIPRTLTVPAGESSKSLEELGRLAEIMARSGFDRGAFIVALGGGVVGDLAGFLAAVYYRGIPFVQVPTTVVAQVDSSIGGKTGVNLPAGKNLLGAFYPPALVIADVQTLASLPDREFNEGIAEAIKHAIIRDPDLLARLEKLDRADSAALVGIIRRNLEIKAEIVEGDEFERSGDRALLNFGHTVGHAVEQAAGYGRFRHGEAVSLGMVAAARLSCRKSGLAAADYVKIVRALEHFRLPTMLPDDVSTEDILASMTRDKKFEHREVRFVLTPEIGQAFVSTAGQVTWNDLREEVESLRRPFLG